MNPACYNARKTRLGASQGLDPDTMILENLPQPGFFAVFHREGNLFRAKIANSSVLNNKT
jgi:hypothetical protein